MLFIRFILLDFYTFLFAALNLLQSLIFLLQLYHTYQPNVDMLLIFIVIFVVFINIFSLLRLIFEGPFQVILMMRHEEIMKILPLVSEIIIVSQVNVLKIIQVISVIIFFAVTASYST